MSKVNELLEQLEDAFPTCHFSKRGKYIKLHNGSFHGEPAFDMNADDPKEEVYILGVHRDIVKFVEVHDFFCEFAGADTIHINPVE